MEHTMLFGEVFEAIEKLSLEDQAALIGILHEGSAANLLETVGTHDEVY